MGDVGVATSPDLNSQHWNPAKFAFIEDNAGVSFSFVPWLRKLGITDINLLYLTGFYKFDKRQSISSSLRYFTLGEIMFTDEAGQPIKPVSPNEFAIDVAYSRLLGKSFSGSVAFRFIYSDLTQGVSSSATSFSHAGVAFASDVAFYYQHNVHLKDKDGVLSFGLNMSNIGNKIKYSESTADFLPINMRLGSSLKINLDEYNSFSFSLDLNKLMIPTTPVYWKDSLDVNGKPAIRYGLGDPNASVPVAMFRSFYDAPGFPIDTATGKRHVFLEELREINVGLGVEYWYAKQFAARAGYFYEDATKGNRKYFTLGIGLRYTVFGLDVSYLISNQNNPLANTIRFTLLFLINTGQSNKHYK